MDHAIFISSSILLIAAASPQPNPAPLARASLVPLVKVSGKISAGEVKMRVES